MKRLLSTCIRNVPAWITVIPEPFEEIGLLVIVDLEHRILDDILLFDNKFISDILIRVILAKPINALLLQTVSLQVLGYGKGSPPLLIFLNNLP